MKLLVFLALLGFAFSEYLDNDHCEYGPSHWCSNLYYAKKCGAVQHCIDTVWTKQMVQGTEGDSSCTVCQLMVDNSRQLIKNKASDVEVANLLAKACVVMPSKVIASECKKTVLEYMPELFQLLKSEVNVKMICSVIGICRGLEDNAIRENVISAIPEEIKSVKPVHANDYCEDCKRFFGDVKALITANGTEEEFERMVETIVCDSLGSIEGLCRNLVKQYAPIAFNYLSNFLNVDDVCMSIQFCKANTLIKMEKLDAFKSMIKKNVKSNETCAVCKDVVTQARNLVRDQNLQKELENLLDNKVCPLFSTSADVCRQYVDAYAPVLFQLLSSEMDPNTVCNELGVCPARAKVTPVLHRVSLHRMLTSRSRSLGKVAGGQNCALCEFVLKELDDVLGQNKTEAAVKHALDSVCSLLPSTLNASCVNLVNQYSDMIIKLLAQEVDPKLICTEIGLCTQVKKAEKVGFVPCALCKMILEKLESLIGTNRTEEAIRAALDEVCDVLPSSYERECRTFVNKYTDKIVEYMLKKVVPSEICRLIGLCFIEVKIEKKVAAGPECALCEFILREIDNILGQNKSEAAVKKALDAVCSILPSTISNECTAFVNTYEEVVVELLIQEIDPKVICKKINACTTSKLFPSRLQKLKAPVMTVKRTGDSPICDICKQVVNYLDELLKANASAQDLEMALERVCSILPQSYRNECDSLVDTYGPYILQLLSEVVDPTEVCEKLTLCNRQKSAVDNTLRFKPHPLLGKEKCTYGPDFWCASNENAKICNAEEHCRKHVWKQ